VDALGTQTYETSKIPACADRSDLSDRDQINTLLITIVAHRGEIVNAVIGPVSYAKSS
jgi:hypothetical protein